MVWSRRRKLGAKDGGEQRRNRNKNKEETVRTTATTADGEYRICDLVTTVNKQKQILKTVQTVGTQASYAF